MNDPETRYERTEGAASTLRRLSTLPRFTDAQRLRMALRAQKLSHDSIRMIYIGGYSLPDWRGRDSYGRKVR